MNIQPLGEQIIIRTIPQDSVGSIIVPDSAKGITLMDPAKPNEAVHFVEAEVIAIGTGKRLKDLSLVDELADALRQSTSGDFDPTTMGAFYDHVNRLLARVENPNSRQSFSVKPGDRILYHPAVQKFDRELFQSALPEGNELAEQVYSNGVSGSRYFIIREDSVLAVIENA